MPVNDSAGTGVYLIDKSQRPAPAIGFRSAGAIEADRGLCNTPTLISSDADYVKVFGTPRMERHGKAAMEAYMLAQRKVPQVLTRAKNPGLTSNSPVFGMLKFSLLDRGTGKKPGLTVEATPASTIAVPSENETALYFKGEGDYCTEDNGNIVIRVSEAPTQSAYAKDGRPFQLQVFDFDGANHIDQDVPAELAFNPDVSSLVSPTGEFRLDGFNVGGGAGSGNSDSAYPVTVTAFVNGRVGSPEPIDASDLYDKNYGLFDFFAEAITSAKKADGNTPVVKSEWLDYVPYSAPLGEDVGSGFDENDLYGYYMLDSREGTRSAQQLNCFGLSVTLTASAELPISEMSDVPNHRKLVPGFYSFGCGSVTIVQKDGGFVAKFSISTSLYLRNRNSYMFMGPQNSYWASYYGAYCKETYTLSLSYDDFDSNYISMQADSILGGSNYVVSKSSDTFGDYSIDYAIDDITTELHYFTGDIESNDIGVSLKSYASSVALSNLLGDNLTRWRCVVAPNLGDTMNQPDYLAAITAAGESTLGLSNIGRIAAFDVFGNNGNNMNGRHGNRFIADYSQYGYRTLAGKRTAVTMACLVTELLNSNYNAGIAARPPFAYNYGEIFCLALSQQFTGPERALLKTQYKVNPVIEDGGYYLWAERTSQRTDTSLSDIHSIISYIFMKFDLYDAMKSFVGEYNDASTVNRGLAVLYTLVEKFKSRNYVEEALPSADHNVLGDEVLRFDLAVRFKGVANYVDVYVTAYSQTQTLAISLTQEA